MIQGGKRHPLGGNFFEPTVIANVNTQMKVAREETFGPLAPIFRFETDDEAVQLANDTEFGLAAYFYSRDIGRIWRVAEQLEYGIVGINTGIISTEVAPFGGMKESGIGREGSHYGLDEFLEVKYMCMGDIEQVAAFQAPQDDERAESPACGGDRPLRHLRRTRCRVAARAIRRRLARGAMPRPARA